jgi:predicted HicB family RNase H-like nuclease
MPTAKPNRMTTNLRLDETLHAKAKLIAKQEERPLNSQFEYWIKKGIEKYESENGAVELPKE